MSLLKETHFKVLYRYDGIFQEEPMALFCTWLQDISFRPCTDQHRNKQCFRKEKEMYNMHMLVRD